MSSFGLFLLISPLASSILDRVVHAFHCDRWRLHVVLDMAVMQWNRVAEFNMTHLVDLYRLVSCDSMNVRTSSDHIVLPVVLEDTFSGSKSSGSIPVFNLG